MKTFMSIALLMRKTRERKDYSQSKLARKLGFKNGQFMSNVERGLCSLPGSKINITAYVLDIKVETIISAMTIDYKDNLNQETRKNKNGKTNN